MITLSGLKNQMSDREKVLKWLEAINETDPECINEVIEQCASDPQARAYYVGRYEQMLNL